MIKFYNTLTRSKEEFKPREEGKAGIYSCGPTVYSSPHIGNMYAYIAWDILVRTLKYVGYEVNQVMNITDVGHLTSDADEGEDKMEKGSKREGVSVWEIAKKYESEFMESLEMLNIVKPLVFCRATDHIKDQIELIERLEKNGFTYQISDGIYFDTAKFPGYCDFARLNPDKIKEGARVEENREKRGPCDFALWKFSPCVNSGQARRQMEWESPWGVGFPGWHIECTAMSTKYLGETFDIHTGGEDHIPIHHTNEIAQGCGAFGHQTANYWIHNAFITIGQGKMSKSVGEVYTIRALKEKGFDPMVYRYLAINSHYRKGMTFSLDGMATAELSYRKLLSMVLRWKQNGTPGGKVSKDFKQQFVEAIENDLAMPEAMAVVWKLAKSDLADGDKLATILDFDKVLGLKLDRESIEEKVPEAVVVMAKNRQRCKEEKKWAEADTIRNEIRELGYIVEDTKEGYIIRKI
ncbi:MAG: cysteine--tRNA ligase [Candidatus Shapirobacteria bacterium]|jgi:cysteinyl-tRNA synthetase